MAETQGPKEHPWALSPPMMKHNRKSSMSALQRTTSGTQDNRIHSHKKPTPKIEDRQHAVQGILFFTVAKHIVLSELKHWSSSHVTPARRDRLAFTFFHPSINAFQLFFRLANLCSNSSCVNLSNHQ